MSNPWPFGGMAPPRRRFVPPALPGIDFAGAASGWTFGEDASAVALGSGDAVARSGSWEYDGAGWLRVASGGAGGLMDAPSTRRPGDSGTLCAWLDAPSENGAATGLVFGFFNDPANVFLSDALSLVLTWNRLPQVRRRTAGNQNVVLSGPAAVAGPALIGATIDASAVALYVNGAKVGTAVFGSALTAGTRVGFGLNAPVGLRLRQAAMYQLVKPPEWFAEQARRCGVAA